MESDELSNRLRRMLLDTTAASGSECGPGSSHPLPSRRLLVEVVRGREDEVGEKRLCDDEPSPGSSGSKGGGEGSIGSDDDDDAPPPIHFRDSAPSAAGAMGARGNDAPTGGWIRNGPSAPTKEEAREPPTSKPSLAERMMDDAKLARRKERLEKERKDRRRSKKSTFGMKKGFLNFSSVGAGKKEKVGKKSGGGIKNDVNPESEWNARDAKHSGLKGAENGRGDLIYELDEEGNMVPSCLSLKSDNQRPTDRDDLLHFPEFRTAMLNQLTSNSSQWATPDLIDLITHNHPHLLRGMSDPRYVKALQGMQSDPKGTLERLKNESPDVMRWLTEFCGVMGEHFVKIGEEQGEGVRSGPKKNKEKGGVVMAENNSWVREMGPLEEKALKKHKERQRNDENSVPKSDKRHQKNCPKVETDKQVASILDNDELRSILLDPTMQRVMEECSTQNGRLRHYMQHKEHGPRLRRLMDAGLLRLA